ncbi:MAG: dockerin type I domain-containing protein, partial [Saprospiraceae bacterium]|nr:dockerin type I domain-containing protein [Saprospiraceae bacterium]
TECFQKVYVFCRSDYEVKFPADVVVNCTELGGVPLSELSGRDITAIAGEPEIHDDECELIGVSYEDQRFTIVDEACYKIVRKWTVIDWCKYDPDAHYRGPEVIVDDRYEYMAGPDRPCIYRFLKDNGDGYMTYTQVIKVVDTEAPVVVCDQEEATICIYDDNCDEAEVELLLGSATDDCTPDDKIAYRWFTTDNEYHGHGNVFGQDNGSAVGVEVGRTYDVYLVAKDRCGNEDTCVTEVEVRDCKPPTPYCYAGVVTVVMPNNGMVTIWATDLLEKAEDNCDRDWPAYNDIEVSFSDDVDDKSRDYDCDTIPNGISASFMVEVWVTDSEGNQDFCRTFVEVQDNSDGCPDSGGAAAQIAGQVKTEFTEPVEAVEVELLSGGRMYTTGVDGQYAFENVLMGSNYNIVPSLDANPLNGVSTLDLVLMQKHILGIEKLDSPYKVIAADVNKSNSVSALDVVETRKLILGIYDNFPSNKSWRFIPNSHTFVNAESPWGFPEEVAVENLSHNMRADFVGVKVGDVNDSNVPHSLMGSAVRSTGELTLLLNDRVVNKGEEVRIEVLSRGFDDIVGYQYTLEAAGLHLKGVEPGAISVDENNFGVLSSGVVTTSWHDVKG